MRLLKCLLLVFMAASIQAHAEYTKFFNLTASEVRIDSMLPAFSYAIPLSEQYADSVYTVSILYPEYIDVTSTEASRYEQLNGKRQSSPAILQEVLFDRRNPSLRVSFCPVIYRDGRYQALVSFMLKIESKALKRSQRMARKISTKASRYASHSVLASGNWAKIRVPSTGVYQITESLIRAAGFSDITKVKVYGYGGNLQNEKLNASDLIEYDDLKEVPICLAEGKRLFYARGPVSWQSQTSTRRTRNYYSDYGYYFITQADSAVATIDSTAFLNTFYPAADDYHQLYEKDGFSWYNGGRNLFDSEAIALGGQRRYTFHHPSTTSSGTLAVSVSAGMTSRLQVWLNDSLLGTQSPTIADRDHDFGCQSTSTYRINHLGATDTVRIVSLSGGVLRLDYISWTYDRPAPAPVFAGSFPSPEYVYNITNQDHHADGQADMVIIIPTSQKLLKQAQRLKTFHETHDSLRVTIVPADELYNEFSSGTPDGNAYRRYLKMLYDRASTSADMPKYLLLFGDCFWDNRMVTSEVRSYSPDDYLLCFESENSFNNIACYVDDGFFALLDDGEGSDPQTSDLLDLAVGRFPVDNETDAQTMVDKTIAYAENKNAGAWQNTLMFMGDDGNQNLHMTDVDAAAEQVASSHPGFLIKKVMWDSYQRTVSSTGNTYPDVTRIIKQQQSKGALIMDYAGHGNETQLSHEAVLRSTDFANFTNTNLPLWITASCDILPFDHPTGTLGETAVLNPKGGAVAFFGTTRTVYADRNAIINRAYLKYVLSKENGKPITMGEAQRLAKNELTKTGSDRTTNKLQYSLLGDPALALNLPLVTLVVDSINGMPVSKDAPAKLKAGTTVKVAGHIEGSDNFNGTVTATIRDSRELVTCRQNDRSQASVAFQYYDRTKTIFSGTDSVRNSRFNFTFAVPMDIKYSDESGLMNLYAVNNSHTATANGYTEAFTLGGTGTAGNDSIGPSIYCYLNSPSFSNGGNVNTTPYFVAKVSDEDGINSTGNGVGHDLQLIIDNDPTLSYVLNDNFSFDFGSYTSGSTFFALPELQPGKHQLKFRAWDVLNNSSTATLDFTVVHGLQPNLIDVNCTNNPATSSTTFILTHDRMGNSMDVEIDVFDLSGRQLWKHQESGVSQAGSYTVNWDLTTDGGRRMQTGVYVYRARISCEGSEMASKSKKLIVIGNN